MRPHGQDALDLAEVEAVARVIAETRIHSGYKGETRKRLVDCAIWGTRIEAEAAIRALDAHRAGRILAEPVGKRA